jgi:hypothetical protein
MNFLFDERKLLPLGVHDASLEEIDEHFARFQRSDRRMRLCARLKAYAGDVKRAGWKCDLVIDGSFVMLGVDEPEDVDIILVLPADWDADLRPYEYNLVSKKRVKKEYGLDVFPVRSGSAEEQNWISFFSRVNIKWCRQFHWPVELKKGLLRVHI